MMAVLPNCGYNHTTRHAKKDANTTCYSVGTTAWQSILLLRMGDKTEIKYTITRLDKSSPWKAPEGFFHRGHRPFRPRRRIIRLCIGGTCDRQSSEDGTNA